MNNQKYKSKVTPFFVARHLAMYISGQLTYCVLMPVRCSGLLTYSGIPVKFNWTHI
jgi:hypothetical protein